MDIFNIINPDLAGKYRCTVELSDGSAVPLKFQDEADAETRLREVVDGLEAQLAERLAAEQQQAEEQALSSQLDALLEGIA